MLRESVLGGRRAARHVPDLGRRGRGRYPECESERPERQEASMIEEEWVEGATPQAMLGWLRRKSISDRRLRLFACACCRRIWDLLPDEQFQRGIQVAEWFAEKAVDPGVL